MHSRVIKYKMVFLSRSWTRTIIFQFSSSIIEFGSILLKDWSWSVVWIIACEQKLLNTFIHPHHFQLLNAVQAIFDNYNRNQDLGLCCHRMQLFFHWFRIFILVNAGDIGCFLQKSYLNEYLKANIQGLTSTRYPTLPGFFFTTRTLPGIFLKISGFRVVTIHAVFSQ